MSGLSSSPATSGSRHQGRSDERPRLALEADHADDPVPAARVGQVLAVRLVVQADADEPSVEAEEVVAGAEDEHQLRFVVGLAERAGLCAAVHLPARRLRVAEPQVAALAEDLLRDLGLEADLELGLEVVLTLGDFDRMPGSRARRELVGIVGPDTRQDVQRLVGAQSEGAELGLARKLPAAVEERARDRWLGRAGRRRGRARHELGPLRRRRRLRDAARTPVPPQRPVVAGQALGIGGDADAGFGRDWVSSWACAGETWNGARLQRRTRGRLRRAFGKII